MSDVPIPEDIREAADRAYVEYASKDYAHTGIRDMRDCIARAICHERERNRADMENLLRIIASRNEALERYENDQMGL